MGIFFGRIALKEYTLNHNISATLIGLGLHIYRLSTIVALVTCLLGLSLHAQGQETAPSVEAVVLSDEPEIKQIVCDRYFNDAGGGLFCVTENENQKPVVRGVKIEANHFVETIRFTGTHSDIGEIVTCRENIYCMYHNGVVERRRRNAIGVVVASLKLESKRQSVGGMIYPDYFSEGALTIYSSRDFNGPSGIRDDRITRVNLSERKPSLTWEIKGDFHYSVQFDFDGGFYSFTDDKIQKRDITTGDLVAELDCTQKWPTRLADGTIVLSGDGTHEFWDLEKRILKRTVAVPNSRFEREFLTVRCDDGDLKFVDLSGKPIPKYSRIDTRNNEFVFSVQDEKVILRNPDSRTFRVVDMLNNEQIAEQKEVHSMRLMPQGQIVVIETIDDAGNPVEQRGGCAPGPSRKLRFSILSKNPPVPEAK